MVDRAPSCPRWFENILAGFSQEALDDFYREPQIALVHVADGDGE